MSKGKSGKITYKPYEQRQPYLIPPSADVKRLAGILRERIERLEEEENKKN